MKPEDHSNLINEIATNLSDPARVNSILTQIREDYTDVTTSLVTAEATAKDLTLANENLQKYNMELFLSRGIKADPETKLVNHEEDKKLSYDDLDLTNF